MISTGKKAACMRKMKIWEPHRYARRDCAGTVRVSVCTWISGIPEVQMKKLCTEGWRNWGKFTALKRFFTAGNAFFMCRKTANWSLRWSRRTKRLQEKRRLHLTNEALTMREHWTAEFPLVQPLKVKKPIPICPMSVCRWRLWNARWKSTVRHCGDWLWSVSFYHNDEE